MNYQKGVDGIYQPEVPVLHRNEEYDESSFPTLRKMQEEHFWYRGRHRFLLYSFLKHFANKQPRAIDLGGGAGGWVGYLATNSHCQFQELALADSSLLALQFAKDIVPEATNRYQIDLMNLGWQEQWDCVFLLDVIEHLPDDTRALEEAAKTLRPGGKLFVTAPALNAFWSYNDELAHHLRRYSKASFSTLADKSGLKMCEARYFMFFLSPVYWLARQRRIEKLSNVQRQELLERTHRIPSPLINNTLSAIFSAETPIGHVLSFPWGTSILGVFEKQ